MGRRLCPDASDLKVEQDSLQGQLRIVIQPDRWIPDRSLEQSFTLHLEPRNGKVETTYKSRGAMGEYEGTCSGELLELWQGSYNVSGLDACSGNLYLGICALPAGRQLSSSSAVAAVPAEPLPAGLQIYRELQALHRIVSAPHLDFNEAQKSCFVLEPQTNQDPTQTEAYLKQLVDYATAAGNEKRNAELRGVVQASNPQYVPYHGALDKAFVENKLHRLDSSTEHWQLISAWRCIGPLLPTADRPVEIALPAVLPSELNFTEHALRWEVCETDSLCTLPAKIREAVSNAKLQRFVWYGTALVESEKEETVWAAVPANTYGKLWVNCAPVWSTDACSDALETAVFPVQFKKGINTLLFQAGIDGLNFVGKGSSPPNGFYRLELACFGVALNVKPPTEQRDSAPKTSNIPLTANDAVGGNPNTPKSATPPVAWDLKTNTNIAWRRTLPVASTDLTCFDNKLYLLAKQSLYCLDAESGKTLWETVVTEVPDESGMAAPLVTAEGIWSVLDRGTVVHLNLEGKPRWTLQLSTNGRPQQPSLSGEKLWDFSIPGGANTEVMRLERGTLTRELLVSGSGLILDLADGKILHKNLTGPVTENGLVTLDGDLIFITGTGADYVTGGWWAGWKCCNRVWLDANGEVGRRFLWRKNGPSHRGGPALAGDGLLYLFRASTEHHMEFPSPTSELHVYDAESGRQLTDIKPMLSDALRPTTIQRVGPYLYCMDIGGKQPFVFSDKAQMAVVWPGENPAVLARNEVPQAAGRPAFSADRLFFASPGEVLCIAALDQASRKFELDTISYNLYQGSLAKPIPAGQKLYTPEPMPEPDYRQVPITTLSEATMPICPQRWLALGPLPLEIADEVFDAQGGPGRLKPLLGSQFEIGNKTYRFDPFDPAGIVRHNMNYVQTHNGYHYTPAWCLDLKTVGFGKTEVSTYLYAVLYNERPRTYQLEMKGQGCSVWLGGQELKPGDFVRLRVGYYPLLLQARVGRLPPVKTQLVLRIGLLPRPGPEEQLTQWRLNIQRYRDALQYVAKYLPESPHALRAQSMLDELEATK